jgi:hypothetical protein
VLRFYGYKEANQVVGKANDSMVNLTTSTGDISKVSEETSKSIKMIDEISTTLLKLMSHDFKLVLDYPHESGDQGADHGMQ